MRNLAFRLAWMAVLLTLPGCVLDRLEATRHRDATAGSGGSVDGGQQGGNAGATVVLPAGAFNMAGTGSASPASSAGTMGNEPGAGASFGGVGVVGAAGAAGESIGANAGRSGTIGVDHGGAGSAGHRSIGGGGSTGSGGGSAASGGSGGTSTGGGSSGTGAGNGGGGTGGNGTGGTANNGGNGGGGVAGGTNPSSGGVAGTPISGSLLHAPTSYLGPHHYRVVYDFSNPDQLLDWVVPSPSCTEPLRLVNGELAVNYCDLTRGTELAMAQFKWPLQLIQFKAKSTNVESRTLGFEHTNIYAATVWQGTWQPAIGYGCIFTNARFFTMALDESMQNRDPTFANLRGSSFLHSVDMSASVLSWTTQSANSTDARPAATLTSLVSGFYDGTSRYLLIGGFESSNRFDDIVIEGNFQDM